VAQLPAPQRGRAAAFLPGGPEAKRLAEQPVVIIVGDSVFVHGGLRESHVRYGLPRLNAETRAWMLGETAQMPAPLQSEDAPTWLREYSDGLPFQSVCERLSAVLSSLHVKRMVVGHTVQKNGINSACGGKVWRIDVGLSKFYGGAPSALEIRSDHITVLSAPSAAQPAATPEHPE
jgi:hypothetical protein